MHIRFCTCFFFFVFFFFSFSLSPLLLVAYTARAFSSKVAEHRKSIIDKQARKKNLKNRIHHEYPR